MTLLTEEEITTALGTLEGWTRSGASITATVELADFREAMLYTGAVAYLAVHAFGGWAHGRRHGPGGTDQRPEVRQR